MERLREKDKPYFGVMHKDREKYPTLASDLMEEWRAVLIDTTALSMLNGHELVKEDFYTGIDQPGVFLEKDGFRKYIQKLEGKFVQKTDIFRILIIVSASGGQWIFRSISL